MAELSFTIPGKPFGKQRARTTRQGRMYTPKETVAFESLVRAMALEIFSQPIEGPIGVKVLAIFEPPPSWSKRKRAAALNTWHTQKPDSDNIIKAVLDGLNRVAFADDSQVSSQHCEKVWGIRAQTLVTLTLLGNVSAPHVDP